MATDSASYLGLGCSGGADRWPAVGLLAVVAGAALVVAMEGSGKREKWSWRCGVPRRAAQGLLYAREGRFGRGYLSSESFDGRQWRWKYLGVDFGRRASVQRGAVGWDASCRRLL
jgi:hypothetical protein